MISSNPHAWPCHVRTKGLDNLDLVGAQREPGPQWPQWLSARCFHRKMFNCLTNLRKKGCVIVRDPHVFRNHFMVSYQHVIMVNYVNRCK